MCGPSTSARRRRRHLATYASPVTGGAATLAQAQQNVTPAQNSWAQQMEIWTTPWGFIKGAQANGAIVAEPHRGRRTRYWRCVTALEHAAEVPRWPEKPYRVVGYLNNGLVEKVQARLDYPVFGDMLVESEYPLLTRDNRGLKYPPPRSCRSAPAGWCSILQVLGALPILRRPAEADDARPLPRRGGWTAAGRRPRPRRPPPRNWLMAYTASAGAYTPGGGIRQRHLPCSSEPGPQSEARALAGIAEVKRLFPAAHPLAGVPTHHHIDQALPRRHRRGPPPVV